MVAQELPALQLGQRRAAPYCGVGAAVPSYLLETRKVAYASQDLIVEACLDARLIQKKQLPRANSVRITAIAQKNVDAVFSRSSNLLRCLEIAVTSDLPL